MNRTELVEAIAASTGDTKAATERFLAAFLESVQNTVAKQEKVSIAGFGTFESHQTSARKGRNPGTGKPLDIPASVRPKFKPGTTFTTLVKTSAIHK